VLKEPQIREMNTVQSDLVEWYVLETEFFQDHVRHTRYVETGKIGIRGWRRIGETVRNSAREASVSSISKPRELRAAMVL